MLTLKIDYPLPSIPNMDAVDFSKLIFTVFGDMEYYGSYEIDSGGYLYQNKLDESGNIIGVSKLDDYTGMVYISTSILGDNEDIIIVYKLVITKGKVLEATLEKTMPIDSQFRKLSEKMIEREYERSKKIWFKYLYFPYSITCRFIAQIILRVIFVTSAGLMRLIEWVYKTITPYG